MVGQAVGYAASALGYLALAGDRPVLVREIAEACDIPAAYLAKIVNSLRRLGLVDTQRGVGGGVTIARSPDQISLLELCRALGDPIVERRCMLGTAQCSEERACPAHAFWSEHRQRAVEFLTATTVADFAAFEARRRLSPNPSPPGFSAPRHGSPEALSDAG
jgi:Rrf2 family iron-sulfur cluster assembly transcriptional regulator